jgi:hypothetical protein
MGFPKPVLKLQSINPISKYRQFLTTTPPTRNFPIPQISNVHPNPPQNNDDHLNTIAVCPNYVTRVFDITFQI